MLSNEQAATVKGMLARGDYVHDVAAVFGVNQGRIAEIKNGQKFAEVKPAPMTNIPPPQAPRVIDPNAPVERQWEILLALIKNPPENSRVVTLTPQLAEMILGDLNSNNRKRRPSKIKRFAAAMLAKRFMLTGDTVKFSREGFLLDGQNRLTACVRAGIAFRTHVVFGIDHQAFAVIDAGAGRTNPDTLKIAGVPYPEISAQAVRWLMIYEKDPLDRGRSVDNAELLEYYRSRIDKDRLEAAVTRAIAAGRWIPRGSLAAHLYLFDGLNSKIATRFARDVAEQKGGARKLILKFEKLRKQNLGRLHETQVNALIIQAWNAYRKGVALTLSMLNWDEAKDFPSIV